MVFKEDDMRSLASMGSLILIALIAGLIFLYSGFYNVAATGPRNPWMEWLLSTTSDRSVAYHARGIFHPSYLNAPEIIKAGFDKYRKDCAMCHGTPASYPGEVGKGLNPKPPKLWKSAQDMSDGELFWVIQNGIEMTDMPSWSHEYKEKDIWSVVAFLKQLPNISAQQYQDMVRASSHGGN